MGYRARLREMTLMVASAITIIGTTAIAAALPQMNDAFASVPHGDFLVHLALTLPALSAGLCAPFMGLVVDRLGRKRLLVAALVLYGCAGCAGFLLHGIESILVSRFVLGIAVSGVATCATALIADYARQGAMGASMGRQSLFMSFGNVVFVFTGGLMATAGWRWPFLIYAVGFLLLPGAVLLIREPERSDARVPAVDSAATGAPTPLRARSLAWIYALLFVNMMIYFMVPVHLPFYLSRLEGSGSAAAGSLLSVVGVTWALSATQYKRLERHWSYEQLLVLTFSLLAVANVLLALAPGYAMVIVALVVMGAGLGLCLSNLNTWLLTVAPAHVRGRAVGLLVFFSFMGQFFSPVLTQPLTSSVGYRWSYGAAGGVLASIVLVTLVRIVLQGIRTRRAAPVAAPGDTLPTSRRVSTRH